MTVVVAMRGSDGECWVAADSRSTDGTGIVSDTEQKLHRVGGAWVGGSGDGALRTVLERIYVTSHERREDWAAEFVTAVRRGYDALGWGACAKDGEAPHWNAAYVAAHPDGPVLVGGQLHVVFPPRSTPVATGCGAAEALGAATALVMAATSTSTSAVVVYSARVACRLDACCGGDVQLRCPEEVQRSDGTDPDSAGSLES